MPAFARDRPQDAVTDDLEAAGIDHVEAVADVAFVPVPLDALDAANAGV